MWAPEVPPRLLLFHDRMPWARDWWEAQKKEKKKDEKFPEWGWTQDLSQEINQYTHTHTYIMIFIAHSVSPFVGCGDDMEMKPSILGVPVMWLQAQYTSMTIATTRRSYLQWKLQLYKLQYSMRHFYCPMGQLTLWLNNTHYSCKHTHCLHIEWSHIHTHTYNYTLCPCHPIH